MLEPACRAARRSATRPPPQPNAIRAVVRRAEVVQHPPAVGERLAAGPADPLEHVGHRLGQHDVARRDLSSRANRASASVRQPAASTADARAHVGAAGARGRRTPPSPVARPRATSVCSWIAHAALRAAPRAARTRGAPAARSPRCAGPRRARKTGERQIAWTSGGLSGRTRRRDRARRRRSAASLQESSWARDVAISTCGTARYQASIFCALAELADRADRVVGRLREAHRAARRRTARRQLGDVAPVAVDEAAVAPAGPVAAARRPRAARRRVAGLALEQVPRGPHPEVAAADRRRRRPRRAGAAAAAASGAPASSIHQPVAECSSAIAPTLPRARSADDRQRAGRAIAGGATSTPAGRSPRAVERADLEARRRSHSSSPAATSQRCTPRS